MRCDRFQRREWSPSNVRDLDRTAPTALLLIHRFGVAIGGRGFGSLSPKLGNLKILDTDTTSLTLQAQVNFTNPTKYSATVPYFNINILVNGTILGQATATDVAVVPGNNTNVLIKAVYDPFTYSGKKGRAVGRELLSQYISGMSITTSIVKFSAR